MSSKKLPKIDFFQEAIKRSQLCVFNWNTKEDSIWLSKDFVKNQSTQSTTLNMESLLETIHPGDQKILSTSIRHYLSKDQNIDFFLELRFINPEDDFTWYKMNFFQMNEFFFIGYIQNIDNIKAVQSLLSDAHRKAEISRKNQAEFLSRMSHEVRTPLNGIVGLTDLLIKDTTDEKQLEKLNVLSSCCSNLMHLVNEILDFSKIESGKLQFENRPFSVSELLDNLFLLYSNSVQEKGIEFQLDLSNDIKELHSGDPQRLTQILSNLVQNAIKFTENGKISIHAQISSSNDFTQEISFSVADTGSGIPQDKIESVFTPFIQSKVGQKGTGLGLPISKSLAQMQGGDLTVESEIDKGSKFTLTLPLNISKAKKENIIPKEEDKLDICKSISILIVDDEAVNRLVLSEMLTGFGASIETVSNGKEAVSACETTRFDLIFMDINMPELNGFEASKAIRKMPARSEVITGLTASVDPKMEQNCFESGMNNYLLKPLRLSTLKKYFLDVFPKIQEKMARAS